VTCNTKVRRSVTFCGPRICCCSHRPGSAVICCRTSEGRFQQSACNMGKCILVPNLIQNFDNLTETNVLNNIQWSKIKCNHSPNCPNSVGDFSVSCHVWNRVAMFSPDIFPSSAWTALAFRYCSVFLQLFSSSTPSPHDTLSDVFLECDSTETTYSRS